MSRLGIKDKPLYVLGAALLFSKYFLKSIYFDMLLWYNTIYKYNYLKAIRYNSI